MCGILGFIGKEKISKETINHCLNQMKNRGPDFQDYKEIKVNNSINLYFLHSRLSILDLQKRSNQPFKKKHITLIFNGEIYNYKEIKKDLEENFLPRLKNFGYEIIYFGEDWGDWKDNSDDNIGNK